MRATDVLKAEHRIIEQVLQCLEAIANRAVDTGTVDGTAAIQALDFFRQFADRCHHGKEEEKLFPRLEARGFSPDFGPTSVMRAEHELGRELVRNMADLVDDASLGKPDAVGRFAHHARAYVHLLREHIRKEDHCLFAMADQVLTDNDQAALLDSFEDVEHDDMGPGTHERYLALANSLADRFHVSRTAHGECKAATCCSH